MNTIRIKDIVALLVFLAACTTGNAQLSATVSLQESVGNCGLVTDCDEDVICVDIVLTVNQSKTLDSYNVWVRYDGDVLSREELAPNDNSGQGDNACVLANSNSDNNHENDPLVAPYSYWRVGALAAPFQPLTAGVPTIIHTFCFLILEPDLLDGQEVCTGGGLPGVPGSTGITVFTFTDGSEIENPPLSCMTLDSTFTSCSLLPVEMLSFTARPAGTTAHLEWITAFEYRNDYFEVQRSEDGKTFRPVGTVKGKGDSYVPVHYSFIDHTPVKGVNYYRLKQVDTDGRFTHSAIRTVRFDGQEFRVGIRPNPARDVVYVEASSPAGENMIITVTDMSGRVQRKLATADDLGVTGVDISGLSPGVFMMTVSRGVLSYTEKLVIVP